MSRTACRLVRSRRPVGRSRVGSASCRIDGRGHRTGNLIGDRLDWCTVFVRGSAVSAASVPLGRLGFARPHGWGLHRRGFRSVGAGHHDHRHRSSVLRRLGGRKYTVAHQPGADPRIHRATARHPRLNSMPTRRRRFSRPHRSVTRRPSTRSMPSSTNRQSSRQPKPWRRPPLRAGHCGRLSTCSPTLPTQLRT